MEKLQKPTAFILGHLADEYCRDLISKQAQSAAKVWECPCGSCDARVFYARGPTGVVWFIASVAAAPVGSTTIRPVIHGIETSDDITEMASSTHVHPIDVEMFVDWFDRGLRAALLKERNRTQSAPVIH